MRILEGIPGLGSKPHSIELHGPAAKVYALLEDDRQIQRLRKMPHAGTQAHVFGENFRKHSRWSYCATVLLVADRLASLSLPAYDTEFRLRGSRLSSPFAAAQVLALLTSCGHLPGTYGVEKGVLQWMEAKDVRLSDLFESLRPPDLRRAKELDTLVAAQGYEAVHKVLGAYKFHSLVQGDRESDRLLWDFYVPYLLGQASDSRDGRQRNKWKKVRLVYDMARRVAYMNVDLRHSALPVTFDLERWLQYAGKHRSLGMLSEYTLDSLVTLEHQMFHSLYLRKEARLALAWATGKTFDALVGLGTVSSGVDALKGWLHESDISCIVGMDASPTAETLMATPHVEFDCNDRHAPGIQSTVGLELRLRNLDATVGAAAIWEYVPWPHPKVVVPPHIYGTLSLRQPADVCLLASLVDVLADALEPAWDTQLTHATNASWMEYAMDTKAALSYVYHPLIEQLVSRAMRPGKLVLEAWDLAELFGWAHSELEPSAGVIASAPDLDDPALQLLFKAQPLSTRTDSDMLGKVKEYQGLMAMWARLSRQERMPTANPTRVRSFVLTSKVKLKTSVTREFDGGILQVAPEEGSLRLYLLESKSESEKGLSEDILAAKARDLGLRVLEKEWLSEYTAYIVPVLPGARTLQPSVPAVNAEQTQWMGRPPRL